MEPEPQKRPVKVDNPEPEREQCFQFDFILSSGKTITTEIFPGRGDSYVEHPHAWVFSLPRFKQIKTVMKRDVAAFEVIDALLIKFVPPKPKPKPEPEPDEPIR